MTTQEQIDQMKATIATLEAQGNALIQSEIDSMKQKSVDLESKLLLEIQALEVKAVEEAQAVTETVKTEVAAVETEVSSFWVKYRVELIVTAVLVLSHIAGKFGW